MRVGTCASPGTYVRSGFYSSHFRAEDTRSSFSNFKRAVLVCIDARKQAAVVRCLSKRKETQASART